VVHGRSVGAKSGARDALAQAVGLKSDLGIMRGRVVNVSFSSQIDESFYDFALFWSLKIDVCRDLL